MVSVPFWASVALIISFSTAGGLLYKLGTNSLGTIAFSDILSFKLSPKSVSYLILGAAGALAVLIAGFLLRPSFFAANYLFSPMIFLALVMLFFSRFFIGIPLSTTGLGRLTAVVTTLSVVSTALASAIVFGEAFPPKVIVGIALGVVAVLLIGES